MTKAKNVSNNWVISLKYTKDFTISPVIKNPLQNHEVSDQQKYYIQLFIHIYLTHLTKITFNLSGKYAQDVTTKIFT